MNYQLLTTDEEGMAVRGPHGFFTVFWEQKPAILDAGILAVLPDDPGLAQFYKLQLRTGELPGLERDEIMPGLVRDRELMQIFLANRPTEHP